MIENSLSRYGCLGFVASLCACFASPGVLRGAETPFRGAPWPRHVVDDGSRGADGVRLGDANGDGRPDVVTGWEQGGITRVYLHPGHDRAGEPWPAVTVGKTPSVEDAVFADLDADGRIDVATCCEGKTRTMFVHWAPKDRRAYLDPERWTTEPIPGSENRMMWMFSVPMQVDGKHGIDLVAAGKGGDCQIGWWQSPDDPRRLDQWKWHPISPAGWIMSLRVVDMDRDGDPDVLTSDRKGRLRACRWLENPGAGPAQSAPWPNHPIGGEDHEVMFLTVADLDADGAEDVLCATRDNGLLFFRRLPGAPDAWVQHAIRMPEDVGTGKAVEVGDIDGDGKPDLVFSCENAKGDRSGVVWLSYDKAPTEGPWTAHEISGPAGIKFDRMELLDLDGDGDLDVLACEESQPVEGPGQGLGVFWYENPSSARRADSR
ncbi:MAG TPA: VCBS repeat-containing protein [Thermoguttaceae bacterium]|nr:VCBS repeat-containing protein [Thermoguttaceae bacterium]